MRALAAACTAGLVTATVAFGPVRAQPAAPAPAPPGPDLGRAKALYDSATAEMADGRFADAARDYSAAYDITKDPVLFFKIGTANEKAGKCDVAVGYYQRYLKEASPAPKFVDLTTERITACSAAPAGSGSAIATGSAAPATSDTSDTSAGSGSAAPEPAPPAPHVHGDNVPWLLVGGSLAFVTLGAVLAYSASSSENDILDLYTGVDHVPVTYNATTAQRYSDLVNEGHRYQYLSWTSFGIAAAFGVAAGVFFVHDANERRYSIAPIATPQSAGVSATLRF
jgi:hypothetical protein